MQRNRLAEETSPYLLQHADNPVDWYPWGEEALHRGRGGKTNPFCLSIGYSACHWCHVMAHESFEDPATAALMNELFVNIKVDREERPDLDKIYQVAQQLHHAGLRRLAADHVPDAAAISRPSSAAPIFPRSRATACPRFSDLLRRVAEYYRGHGAEIAAQNEQLQAGVREPCAANRRPTAPTLDDSPLRAGARRARAIIRRALRRLQPSARNFRIPSSIERCLRQWYAPPPSTSPDLKALYMAQPDADAHGRRRHLRSAGRRILALLRRWPVDDSAFRENALRQWPTAVRISRARAWRPARHCLRASRTKPPTGCCATCARRRAAFTPVSMRTPKAMRGSSMFGPRRSPGAADARRNMPRFRAASAWTAAPISRANGICTPMNPSTPSQRPRRIGASRRRSDRIGARQTAAGAQLARVAGTR